MGLKGSVKGLLSPVRGAGWPHVGTARSQHFTRSTRVSLNGTWHVAGGTLQLAALVLGQLGSQGRAGAVTTGAADTAAVE